MDALDLLLVGLTGVLAGTVNTIAGGGSLITLPVLIFLGLPAPVANGTNRVGVILQSGVATWRYHQDGVVDWRAGLRLLVASSAGAALGAMISVELDEALFQQLIGGIMLLMLGVVLLKPKRWLKGREGQPPAHAWWSSPLAFFALGAYGGFLQAGVGVFLLAGLVLIEGRDLLRANAIKVLLVAGFTVVPLGIFLWHDLVAWVPGLVLAVGSALGAWVGARLTMSWGPAFIRWVLVAVVLISSTRLLGLW